ncbi:hypothetical protein WMF39_45155 [Sorangium sp. So ce1504]
MLPLASMRRAAVAERGFGQRRCRFLLLSPQAGIEHDNPCVQHR